MRGLRMFLLRVFPPLCRNYKSLEFLIEEVCVCLLCAYVTGNLWPSQTSQRRERINQGPGRGGLEVQVSGCQQAPLRRPAIDVEAEDEDENGEIEGSKDGSEDEDEEGMGMDIDGLEGLDIDDLNEILGEQDVDHMINQEEEVIPGSQAADVADFASDYEHAGDDSEDDIFANTLKTGKGEGKIIEDVEDAQGGVKSPKVCDRMPIQTGKGCAEDSGWVGVSGEGLCEEARGGWLDGLEIVEETMNVENELEEKRERGGFREEGGGIERQREQGDEREREREHGKMEMERKGSETQNVETTRSRQQQEMQKEKKRELGRQKEGDRATELDTGKGENAETLASKKTRACQPTERQGDNNKLRVDLTSKGTAERYQMSRLSCFVSCEVY